MNWLLEHLMVFFNRLTGFFPPERDNSPSNPNPPAQKAAPATALEERQQLLAHHVRLVARCMTTGLCVYGSRGGLGKTKTVLDTLREEGEQPVLLNGHCTPLSLYTNLFQHPDSIIVCDDSEGLSRNLSALGILRSALAGDRTQERLVTYNSSQIKIPESFNFIGGIILIMNVLPKQSPAWDAVLSRVDQFELDASNEEVIAMMRRLASRGFNQLTSEDCHKVVDFISEFSATRQISLRLLEPSFCKMIYARMEYLDWRDLVKTQLEQIGSEKHPANNQENHHFDLDCLKEALTSTSSVKEAEQKFIEMTGRSRATFFRLKKQHDRENGKP